MNEPATRKTVWGAWIGRGWGADKNEATASISLGSRAAWNLWLSYRPVLELECCVMCSAQEQRDCCMSISCGTEELFLKPMVPCGPGNLGAARAAVSGPSCCGDSVPRSSQADLNGHLFLLGHQEPPGMPCTFPQKHDPCSSLGQPPFSFTFSFRMNIK